MNTGKILWRLAMACAILLLFAPTTPRTSWVYPGGMATHSASWDLVAPLSGIVAIGALIFSMRSRPRMFPAVFGLALAALAFGVSAAASAGHWRSLVTGELDVGGMYAIYPAPLVLPFAIIAAVGFLSLLALHAKQLREVLAR